MRWFTMSRQLCQGLRSEFLELQKTVIIAIHLSFIVCLVIFVGTECMNNTDVAVPCPTIFFSHNFENTVWFLFVCLVRS